MSNCVYMRVLAVNSKFILTKDSYGNLRRIKISKIDPSLEGNLQDGMLLKKDDSSRIVAADDNSYLYELEYGLGVDSAGGDDE